MTPDERLERIAELQREADEGRARIAERIARRDRDPGGELERLMADQRFTHDQSDLIYTSPVEPVGSPPARKNDEPHIIIRSAPSCWSAALPCGKACASCALSCHAFSPCPAMSCRRAWCGCSRTWPATGAGSMSASRVCRARSKFLHARMPAVSA